MREFYIEALQYFMEDVYIDMLNILCKNIKYLMDDFYIEAFNIL